MPPRTSSPTGRRGERAGRARRTSTGTPRSLPPPPLVAGAWASPTRWTPRSATWASTGRATRELIRRSAAEARAVGGALVVGVNTDHVGDQRDPAAAVIDAYVEQLHFAEDQGARVILMASRAPGRAPRGARRLRPVYREVLAQAGRAGDPALAGRHVRPAAGAATAAPTTSRPRSERSWRSSPSTPTDRRHQGVAARRGPRDRPARRAAARAYGSTPATTSTTSTDRGRRGAALRRAARHLRRHRARRAAALQALDAGDRPPSARSSARPCRWPATSSRRRPTTTRPASSSWPGSTATSHFTMVGGLQSAPALPHRRTLVRLRRRRPGAGAARTLAAERWTAYLALHGVRRTASPRMTGCR